MTGELISQPIGKGASSHGFGWKSVLVRMVDTDRRVALCADDFGKTMEIRCDILRSKGNLPEAGEQWLVDQQYGIWTFSAILNGTTRGVEVSNVTDLPETLDNIGGTISQNAAAAAAQANAVTAANNGKVVAKGDLLAGSSASTVARQPAGSDGSIPVYDSTSVTGLTSRIPLALTAPLAGATGAARFVGGTTTGAPTTGTFAKGDHITAADGNVWICTVAGTPGTWVQPAPGNRTVDGSKIQSMGGYPGLSNGAATTNSGIRFTDGEAQVVNGTASAYSQLTSSALKTTSGGGITLGDAGGQAGILSASNGAGIKLGSNTVQAVGGDGTTFQTMKAYSFVTSSNGNAYFGAVSGYAALVSPTDGAGIKFASNTVLAVDGAGGAFQLFKAAAVIATNPDIYIDQVSGGGAMRSPSNGAGIKFGSSLVQITDGPGTSFGPGKCTVMTQTSSGRLKQRIRPLKPKNTKTFTEIVQKVEAKRFQFTHEIENGSGPNGVAGEDHIGFIAEELHKAHPDLVWGDMGDPITLAIAPMSLIAVLWEMNKELVTRIERLERGPV